MVWACNGVTVASPESTRTVVCAPIGALTQVNVVGHVHDNGAGRREGKELVAAHAHFSIGGQAREQVGKVGANVEGSAAKTSRSPSLRKATGHGFQTSRFWFESAPLGRGNDQRSARKHNDFGEHAQVHASHVLTVGHDQRALVGDECLEGGQAAFQRRHPGAQKVGGPGPTLDGKAQLFLCCKGAGRLCCDGPALAASFAAAREASVFTA